MKSVLDLDTSEFHIKILLASVSNFIGAVDENQKASFLSPVAEELTEHLCFQYPV